MNPTEQRIAQAWLTSRDSGVIELTRDWTGPAMPPLALVPDGPGFTALERVADHTFGRESGYFVNGAGEIFFFLELARHPGISPTETPVYLAGDFNGWEHAVGDPAWRLLPASLDGEPVLLFAAPAAGFYATPPKRFKFVTGAHRWLPVSSRAPNAVRDDAGNYNYAIDPRRTGRHLFRFTTAAPVDLAAALGVSWTDHAGSERAPLRPGDFFFRMRSHAPLGAVLDSRVNDGETVFRLFAPRARTVRLHLCDRLAQAGEAVAYAMDRRTDGAWEARLQGNLHGWYYWYTLDGPPNVFGKFERDQPILDPYALAAVGRGGPGIVIDRARLRPAERGFATPQWQDLVIAEAHVADLAARAPVDATPAERRGFTGLRKWVESPDFHLARLGVNAVELQPVQEFDAAPGDYAWGYMPVAWFAPASQYALAPEQGSQVRELQDLVAAFHRRGMAVLFDVVYNHVGVPPHLMHIDKLYYFEQDGAGNLANWSACGNDLRAGAAMARRLIIDSLLHLIEVYGADGFRFDLAELIGVEVLREVEAALKRVKPDVVLIAEPWSFRGHIAQDLRTTGFASWNDGFRNFMREYVRGGGSREAFAYFVKGSPWFFALWPAQSVNYTESHDDRTWIDTITENPGNNGTNPTDRDRRRTHLMCALLLGSIGMPMLAAGQDFLRSKQGVTNTYLRGDLNVLDYGRRDAFAATHRYFADWIAFRRSERGALLRQFARPAEPFFRFCFAPDSTAAAVVFNADRSRGPRQILLAVNPTLADAGIPLGDAAAAAWRQVADHEHFFSEAESTAARPVAATLPLPALGCGLWVAD